MPGRGAERRVGRGRGSGSAVAAGGGGGRDGTGDASGRAAENVGQGSALQGSPGVRLMMTPCSVPLRGFGSLGVPAPQEAADGISNVVPKAWLEMYVLLLRTIKFILRKRGYLP